MSSTSQIRKTDSPILNRQWTLFYTIALTQLLDSKPVGTTRRMMFTLISSSAPEAPVFACVMYRVRVCFFFVFFVAPWSMTHHLLPITKTRTMMITITKTEIRTKTKTNSFRFSSSFRSRISFSFRSHFSFSYRSRFCFRFCYQKLVVCHRSL